MIKPLIHTFIKETPSHKFVGEIWVGQKLEESTAPMMSRELVAKQLNKRIDGYNLIHGTRIPYHSPNAVDKEDDTEVVAHFKQVAIQDPDSQEREDLIQFLLNEDEGGKKADELMIATLLYANGKSTAEQMLETAKKFGDYLDTLAAEQAVIFYQK